MSHLPSVPKTNVFHFQIWQISLGSGRDSSCLWSRCWQGSGLGGAKPITGESRVPWGHQPALFASPSFLFLLFSSLFPFFFHLSSHLPLPSCCPPREPQGGLHGFTHLHQPSACPF